VTKQAPFTKLLHARGARRTLAGWWTKSGWAGECGSEILEFAFCANLYMLFCVGFLELCLALFSLHCVGEASRQAARWASVRGTASSVTSGGNTTCVNPNISTCPAAASDVQTYAQSQPGMASSTAVTVNWCNSDGTTGCTTDSSNAQPGHIVKVKVTYTFAKIPYIRSGGLTLTSTAEKVIWQ
jgi:Flp pilus assembly protein TadG